MKKKVIAAYARVSSEKELQLSAYENQLAWLDEAVEKYVDEGFEIKKPWYVDRGITGTAAKKRPGFLKMLEDAKSGLFDVLLVREVSRFARNTEESIKFSRMLWCDYGVDVWFINDGIHISRPEDNLKLQLMSMIAEQESRKDSERCKAGIAIARQKEDSVWGTGNIMGYKRLTVLDGTKKKFPFVLDEEQAETVRMIKDLYIKERLSYSQIKERLELLGHKTATGKAVWQVSSIGRILHNPFYAGYQRLNQSIIDDPIHQKRIRIDKEDWIFKKLPGYIPRLFTEEEWDIIHNITKEKEKKMAERTRNPRNVIYLWSKKLICQCGSTYRGWLWRSNKTYNPSYGYACSNQRTNKSRKSRERKGLPLEGSCGLSSIPEWKLYFMAEQVFKRIWSNRGDDIVEAFEIIKECFEYDDGTEAARQIELYKEKIEAEKNKFERLKDLLIDGIIDKDEFKRRNTEIIERVGELENYIVELEKLNGGTHYDIDEQLKKVKASLEKIAGIEDGELSNEMLDELINFVWREDNNEYCFFLNLGQEDDENIIIPDEYKLEIVKKNCFKPKTIIKDKRRQVLELVLSFETAEAYKKRHGSYLRHNQYDELKVKVFV